MIDNTTIIKVTNRSRGTAGYTVPDLGNLHRHFAKGETKEVTMEELRKLSYLPGGLNLMKNSLVIQDKEARVELIGEVEPEYDYNKEDIEKLLTQGSVNELLDCLDFAPTGVIDLIKDIAVKIELNDIKKRKAILDKTGFNVTNAIELTKDINKQEPKEQKIRRLSTPGEDKETEKEQPIRRTAPPKYKITSQ